MAKSYMLIKYRKEEAQVPCGDTEKNILIAADVSGLLNDDLFNRAYGTVSAERKAKTDRLRFRKDKNLSLGAEICLIYALHKLGIERLPEITVGEHGKPYFKDKNGIFFSLSHSGDFVLCAVSDTEVGCDIEKIAEADPGIARHFFTAAEHDRIASLPDKAAKTKEFYRYWVLKESFLKATGRGLSLSLDKFEINTDGPITVSQTAYKRDFFFSEYDGITGYCCAVCSKTKPFGALLTVTDISECLLRQFSSRQ